MRTLLVIVSSAALAGTIGPPVLYMTDVLNLAQMKLWMAASAAAWFAATPFWMEGDTGGVE
jgi:hypothetical protein